MTERLLEVKIERVVYRGLGLGRHDGQVVFVPRALPGETWRVQVRRGRRGYLETVPLERVEDAPGRRPSPCAAFPRCGGCAYQDVDYGTQLELKAAVVRDALARAGVMWECALPVAASPEEGWRLRTVLHLAKEGDAARIGFHEPSSHSLVPLERCLHLSTGMHAAAAEIVARAVPTLPFPSELELAESLDGQLRALVLHVPGNPDRARAWHGALRDLRGVSGAGLVTADERYTHVTGSPYLDAVVLGERLRFHVRAFFQGNRYLVEPLAQHVVDAIGDGGDVLDLYAGGGLFTVPLGRRARTVRAAEMGALAVADAEANLAAAGLANVRVHAGGVLAALQRWPQQYGERVVLDPPRAGAGPEVVAALAARRPARIVYVSCDPPTLARDLRQLLPLGYALRDLRCFDLFPDTFHVETVAQLDGV